MVSPLPLPDWAPWWLHLVLLLAILLFALTFLLMPFSTFGVKARLEGVEARLDEIQAEIRSLSLRLPEPTAPPDPYEYDPDPSRPPIPPAPHRPQIVRPRPRTEPGRTEPRLY